MNTRVIDTYELVTGVLEAKSVRYKSLSAQLCEFPCSRLRDRAVVFPGSQSALTHVLYVGVLERNVLLIVAYSKYLRCAKEDRPETLQKVLEINQNESGCIWRLEKRNETECLLAEMTLHLSQNPASAKTQLWSACANLDLLFKKNGPNLGKIQLVTATSVVSKVRDFLTKLGFQRIKETQIPNGCSLLVVLSNDELSESSPFRRFPLKVDITGILAFRIYFSISDAAVTATEPFRTAVKQLLPQLNWILPVGYYNYSTQSNQIQLTLKLHYKLLPIEDLDTCIKAYYDCVISGYNNTVKAIASLYEQCQRSKVEVEDVFLYLTLVEEEARGGVYLEQVEYRAEEKAQQVEDLKLVGTLISDPATARYFLPSPYFLSDITNSIYRKIPINSYVSTEFCTHFPMLRSQFCIQIASLCDRLRAVGVFPTMEMVQASSDLRLVIVPGKGFHSEPTRFLRECLEIFTKAEVGEEIDENSEYFLDLRSFSDFNTKKNTQKCQVVQAYIGSERYYLHPLRDVPSGFAVLLAGYRSRLSLVLEVENTLAGWTKNDKIEHKLPIQGSGYICERAKLGLWTCQNPLQESYQLLLLLEELHNSGNFHLFLSFGSIRKDQKSSRLALILPCLDLVFADLLDSFLGQQWAEFQAPEVQAYLACGQPLESPKKADIYSLCTVVRAVLGKIGEGFRGLDDLLRRGTSSDPQIRPQLLDLKAAFLQLIQQPTIPYDKT